jgi:ribonuclease HII
VPQIRDSKKISPKKRERICDAIMQHAVAYGVGTVSPAEIDAHGMTWANQTAFARALDGLKKEPQRIIIDGILGLPLGCGASAEVHTVVEGDAQYLAIAAASIVAKVSHDRWLQGVVDGEPDLDEKYGLRSCKGYGTAKHRAGIETHGLHAAHRRRFIKGYRPGEACLVKFKSA